MRTLFFFFGFYERKTELGSLERLCSALGQWQLLCISCFGLCIFGIIFASTELRQISRNEWKARLVFPFKSFDGNALWDIYLFFLNTRESPIFVGCTDFKSDQNMAFPLILSINNGAIEGGYDQATCFDHVVQERRRADKDHCVIATRTMVSMALALYYRALERLKRL